MEEDNLKIPKNIARSIERWNHEKSQIDTLLSDRTDFECVRVFTYLLGRIEKRNIEIIDDENDEHKLNDIFYDSIKDDFRFVTEEREKK